MRQHQVNHKFVSTYPKKKYSKTNFGKFINVLILIKPISQNIINHNELVVNYLNLPYNILPRNSIASIHRHQHVPSSDCILQKFNYKAFSEDYSHPACNIYIQNNKVHLH